ncbi:hypothetical protein GKQ38_02105 [Candidatus Nanohaloarchaea archaeon]|nr:hypothetical protein GKQ38_02105 [Candidatus Nanohaloarchaea archaeon]
MDLSEVNYTFTGGELLDRLDNLQGAISTAKQTVGMQQPSQGRIDYASGYLQEAHEELDSFFRQEEIMYPIKVQEIDPATEDIQDVNLSTIEADPDSYEDMVDALREIDPYLGNRIPGLDYTESPSPCAIIDYSTELIEAWEELQEMYSELETAR